MSDKIMHVQVENDTRSALGYREPTEPGTTNASE